MDTGPQHDASARTRAASDRAGQPPHQATEVVLHEERLQVQLERVPVERVVLHRRIVTEVQQVPVTVRREELVVTRVPVTDQQAAVPTAPREPLVIVLSTQVPVIELVTRPYERVVVHVDTITAQQEITETLSREQADIAQTGPARP